MYHFRKTRKEYTSYPKPAKCVFCNLKEFNNKIIKETEYCWIIRNRVQYDVWELRNVVDHLMIIPKRHVKHLGELDEKEKLDVIGIMADYETNDYNVYARSVHSITRSVAHQHTHLIKTGGKIGRATLFMRKPYFFIKF